MEKLYINVRIPVPPSGIALEAINHARNTRIDVVLVDTAGRMQDNEPLMRALSKLISVNDPDLVLFVGGRATV